MTAVAAPAIPTDADRRAFVQAAAAKAYGRKVAASRLYLVAISLALVIAFIPLGDILYNVVRRGAPYISWKFLTTPQQLATEFHQNHFGGISNAITGTTLVWGLGLLIAIPFGVVVGIALYESTGRVMAWFRTVLEVMVGMPSLLFGIFIYSYVVTRMHYQLTQMAGSLALAVLMVPLIAVSCELALRSTPQSYVEAGLALGAKRSTIMRRIVLPYSLPRVWTGIMLAGARAIGETAPVLFVTGASFGTNWNPLSEGTTLPTLAFNDLTTSYYAPVQNEVWGIALVLIAAVLVLNLTSRLIVARATKGRT